LGAVEDEELRDEDRHEQGEAEASAGALGRAEEPGHPGPGEARAHHRGRAGGQATGRSGNGGAFSEYEWDLSRRCGREEQQAAQRVPVRCRIAPDVEPQPGDQVAPAQ